MSREIEMEIGKVARQQAGLVREIARLHHHLLRLKAQYDEIARQREGLQQHLTTEPQQDALQDMQAALLQRYMDTLDDQQLLEELLATTRKSLAWWKQQAMQANERAW